MASTTAMDKEKPVVNEELEDERFSYLIQAYKPFLVDRVNAQDLPYFMPEVFDECFMSELIQWVRSSPRDATLKVFDHILASKQPGKYKSLLKGLEKAKYPMIHDVLLNQNLPNDEHHLHIIKVFGSEILETIDPVEMLAWLRREDVLSNRDAEEITCQQQNNGKTAAAMMLLSKINRRVKDWYKKFFRALYKCGYEDLLKKIDEETYEKVKSEFEYCEDSMSSIETNSSAASTNEKCDKDSENKMKRESVKGNSYSWEASSISNSEASSSTFRSLQPSSLESEQSSTDNQYRSRSPVESYDNSRSEAQDAEASWDSSITQMKTVETGSLNSHQNNLACGIKQNPEVPHDTAAQQTETGGLGKSEESKKGGGDTSEKKMLNGLSDGKVVNKRDKSKDLQLSTQTSAKRSMEEKSLLPAEQTDEVPVDLSDEETEENGFEDEDVPLRGYQWELAKPAIDGKNVIIVAPTGSGKTQVALRIIQEHIRAQHDRRVHKVIFLVEQVALANQQGKACTQLLKAYKTEVISGEKQRRDNVSIKDYIDRRDILVVTAQVLLDALVKKEISISTFSLMIFDECHHAHAKHTFNRIMSMYMDMKIPPVTKPDKFVPMDKSAFPQIVGLTASVGVGKAKTVGDAVKHIKKLMSNLDVEEICTVQQNLGELSEHVSIPDEETVEVSKRSNDAFGNRILEVMGHIEKMMLTSEKVQSIPEAKEFQMVLKAPAEKGSAQYKQWVTKFHKETAKLKDQTVRRFLNPCRNHLEYYNDALIIYNDARIKDAMEYLEEEIKRWSSVTIGEVEQQLLRLYEDCKKYVQSDIDCPNPKLMKLGQLILKAYQKQDRKNCRGIIFVKTRSLAKAIVNWMKETKGLDDLNPAVFTGANATMDRGGLTKNEQVDILTFFRNGKHKLIVATSVAEEGLDISRCNLVIRYDHVTNEIAMVQSRGRGRAEGSKYMVLAEKGSGAAAKEELNMIREVTMMKAIKELQREIRGKQQHFLQHLEKLQKDAKLDRELEAQKRNGRVIMHDGEFELRCLKCDEFVCMSVDIKKIQNAHHAVLDEGFKSHVNIKRLPSPKVIDESIQAVANLLCKECGSRLGNVSNHRNLEFPVLKISQFLIVDAHDRQSMCKKWKDAPFHVSEMTNDDLRRILMERRKAEAQVEEEEEDDEDNDDNA